MKNSLMFAAALIITGAMLVSFSSQPATYALKGNPDGLDKIPDNLFIPDAFFRKYNLQLAPQANAHIKDWSTLERTAEVGVVDDVRWEFNTAEEAMAWHKKNLTVNSENGVQINDKIYIPGAQDLHIYRESKSITDLNQSMGIDTKEFYFLFVINKVVAKVFVTVNGNSSINDALVFAKEAAKDIQNALGIVGVPAKQ